MAQDQKSLEQQISDHYSPLPRRQIVTPVIDTCTGRVRKESMTLFTAIPASRRELLIESSGVKLADSVKPPA